MSSPKKIAELIYSRFDYCSPPTVLVNEVIKLLKTVEGLSEIAAFEIGSNLMIPARDELSQIIEANRKAGIMTTCELIGSERTIIVGSAYQRPTDTEEKRAFRETIPFHNKILKCLSTLEPADFEKFCRKLLLHMGASVSYTTKQSGDEGIDFLAKISLSNSFKQVDIANFEDNFCITIFGQAKRYDRERKVGTPEIRELIGSFIVLQYQDIYDINNSFQYWKHDIGKLRLCDPALCLFMTTGQFSLPAVQLADRTGVVTKDGKQIATYIATNKIGFETEPTLIYSETKFREWLISE